MEIDFFPLLRIFCAHVVADFFLQPYTWIAGRKEFGVRSKYLYYHIATVGILTYVFLADWTEWQLPLFIIITHFVIDWWKSTQKNTITSFSIDQLAHVLMLFLAWIWYIQAFPNWEYIKTEVFGIHFWIIFTAYLLALRPMGFLIGKLTSRWQEQLKREGNEIAGLKDAGTWIGYIERIIILTFILLNQFSSIGFLIAAKSIFRFSGGVKDEQERKHAEYILIGTLISFSAAILLGIVALALIH